MAFVRAEVQDIAEGEISWGETVTGEATQVFTIYLDQIVDDPTIPASYAPPFGDTLGVFVLTKKKPTRTKRSTVWQVECTYTIPQPFQEPKPADDEIDRWNVRFRGGSVPYEVEVDRDKYGKPILNPAGDPVAGVTTPRSDEEIEISFNSVLIPWTDIAACRDKVNSGAVTLTMNGQARTFAPRTMWFRAWTWDYIRDPNMNTYPANTFNLLIRPQTWDKTLTNKGYNYLSTPSTLSSKKTWLDALGNPITTPGYLAADGTKLAVGADATSTAWKIFDEADFAANLLLNVEN